MSMKVHSLNDRITKLEKLLAKDEKPSLEDRVAKLESIVKNEASRSNYEWVADLDKAKSMFIELLKDPVVNPDGYTIDDFKIEMVYDCLYLKSKDITLNVDCPEFRKIMDRFSKLKNYNIKVSNLSRYGTGRGTNLALTVKQKVRNSDYYDDDERMDIRRRAEWSQAQYDNNDWW